MVDSEDCIICGKAGEFYITSDSHRAGPYCAQHRWELGMYIKERNMQVARANFIKWTNAFLKMKKKAKP